uniref:Fungal-type protein kinase domain-containing protein n=1 Tax=Mycena chlorophos TaxID=658473 RepID=A0ABQ0L3S7_MYCCL|nr:predicted protein [Mycena chlorophos]
MGDLTVCVWEQPGPPTLHFEHFVSLAVFQFAATATAERYGVYEDLPLNLYMIWDVFHWSWRQLRASDLDLRGRGSIILLQSVIGIEDDRECEGLAWLMQLALASATRQKAAHPLPNGFVPGRLDEPTPVAAAGLMHSPPAPGADLANPAPAPVPAAGLADAAPARALAAGLANAAPAPARGPAHATPPPPRVANAAPAAGLAGAADIIDLTEDEVLVIAEGELGSQRNPIEIED